VLPWEDVLADMNKGVLEAYLLANVHVLRLIEVGKDIPELSMLFFRRCLSAMMELLRNTKVEPELAQSLKIYNASRCSRSPRAKGEYINQEWVNNAAVQMATMTKKALSINFGRRFHKYLKRTYSIDGKAAYTAVHGILSHEPYVPKGTPLDVIIHEWQDRIPRDARERMTDEPHRIVPLTYTFLKDIEERNQHGHLVKAKGGEFRALRAFSIIPTKKGFQCNHMKMCGLGL